MDFLQRHIDPSTEERIARSTVHAQNSNNVTRLPNVDVLALVGVYANHAAESNRASRPRILVRSAFLDFALIDSHERQLPERFNRRFEGHRHKRGVAAGSQPLRRIVMGCHWPSPLFH